MPDAVDAAMMVRIMNSPGLMAAMRFYDARSVGGATATMAVSMLERERPTLERAFFNTMFSNCVFRAELDGEAVLVTRAPRHVVVTPYGISEHGMLAPQFARVRVYRRL